MKVVLLLVLLLVLAGISDRRILLVGNMIDQEELSPGDTVVKIRSAARTRYRGVRTTDPYSVDRPLLRGLSSAALPPRLRQRHRSVNQVSSH